MAVTTTKKKTAKKAAPKAKSAPKRAASSDKGFAIFATGGKQYQVVPGQSIKIEKIIGDFKEGDKITFDSVLLKGDGAEALTLGAPFIKGASIAATIKKIGRYKTIDVIKYKQKSRYFKKNGHRQPYFEITIDTI